MKPFKPKFPEEISTQFVRGKVLLPSRILLPVILLAIFLSGCVFFQPNRGQINSSTGTGIPVASEFQAFYEENGKRTVFGYPLSDPFIDPESSRLVQYFQRMRLELIGDTNEIIVTPLGEWAVPEPENQVLASVAEPEISRSFPELPYTVQDEFLTFYETNGGEDLFGLPLSAQLNDGGTRAQYFQNAKLEWHPNAPIALRIQVGLLGEAHYRDVGYFEDPGRFRPLDSAGVREAKVTANLKAPILYAGEDQVVFVDVESPDDRRPVAGVHVQLDLTYGGKTERLDLPETDGVGHSQGRLILPKVTPGQKVQVVVTAMAPGGDVIGSAVQSFKTWW